MTVGLGLEVGRNVLRAVFVDASDPGVVLASEYPLDSEDDAAVLDALVESAAIVPSEAQRRSVPVRIAVSPDDLLVQALDVTGMARFEILALADTAVSRGAADSMMLVDDGRRRRLGLVRGHAADATRLASIAGAAGFESVRVEPAPVSLGRGLATGRVLVRRSVDGDTAWLALFEDGFPIAATAVPVGLTGWPAIAAMRAAGRHDDAEAVLTPDELAAHLDALVDGARDRHPPGGGRDADGWPTESPPLSPVGVLHPDFPPHDIRSVARVCGALGAAAGAAEVGERHRRLERLTPLDSPPRPVRRPWAVERVTTEVARPATIAPAADLRPVRRSLRAARSSTTGRLRRAARRSRRNR